MAETSQHVASLDTALVTGASSGIGAAFARLLASRGYDLVLVARREERLGALAQEVAARYGVKAEVLPADLTLAEDVGAVEQRIAGGPPLALLINNAGFGTIGPFSESDPERQADMVRLHVLASVRLARACLPGMIARGQGGIINVASMGAFLPAAGNVTYGASKAYLVFFSRALREELRGTGVVVQALCPGLTRTEFHHTPEYRDARAIAHTPGFLWMSAEQVVAESLRAFDRGRVMCVPGRLNRFGVTLSRLGIVPLLARALPARYLGRASNRPLA